MKNKRVACIGNMNNNFFSLVRYLRDKGVDAHLLLRNNEFKHFLPESDSYSNEYLSYTHHLSWGHVITWYTSTAEKIKSDLDKYDFLIGCGTVPAFLDKSGRSLDLFVPYGSDLYGFPFMRFPWFIPLFFHFSRAQKMSIKKARYICLDFANHDFEKPLEKIEIKGKRIHMYPPVIYAPEYSKKNIEKYSSSQNYASLFMEIRRKHYPVIFHQSRHNWKTSPDIYTWKGNDKLIYGFGDFIKKTKYKNINPALILFEYGSDVNYTKQLIDSLGINDYIYWFPRMARKELMIGLDLADIGTGEFYNSWLLFGSIIEALTLSKPIISYREDDLYKKYYTSLYPLMNVKTSNDITEILVDYVSSPDQYREMGRKGNEWFVKHVNELTLNEIIKIINL